MSIEGKKVAIVATNYFEEIELASPLQALRQIGVIVLVVAPKPGKIKGLQHVKPGAEVLVDVTLSEANPNDFDAVVVPGGALNADHLRVDEKAQQFVRSMLQANKPTAVICHGPWLLVSADLVKNRTLTSYYTIKDDVINAGGRWVDKEVVQDGSLITSRKPDDLTAFNKALLGALQK